MTTGIGDGEAPRANVEEQVLERCQEVFPSWRALTVDDFDFADPKGFSSFTMGIQARPGVAADADPPAVLYRHLEGKENAILESAEERRVFLLLGEHEIAARCLHYDETCRIEEFYRGRTLTADGVYDAAMQRGVAGELHRFHRLDPNGLPEATFFELLFERWGPLVERVLISERNEFPEHERHLCEPLLQLLEPATLRQVLGRLPDPDVDPPVFCHNDTYHGNTFALDDGRVKLLDFEFSCRNHRVFDFANFFAETAMLHGFAEEPHFKIGPPRHTDADLARFIGFYVDREADLDDTLGDPGRRQARLDELVTQTNRAIAASDYMYAMAAIPLSVEPIQKIRFLPYAAQRFAKFRLQLNSS
ncbi:MAG: phosphotransferase [Acidimicrobiia bacterium]|nr:phosphotransferase [Acidimicrobiia bacterium]